MPQPKPLRPSATALLTALLGTATTPARACIWTSRGYVLTSPTEPVEERDLRALSERGLVRATAGGCGWEPTQDAREFALTISGQPVR